MNKVSIMKQKRKYNTITPSSSSSAATSTALTSNISKLNHTKANSTGYKRQHVESRRQLPVYKFRSYICKLVKENEVLLVVAETVSKM